MTTVLPTPAALDEARADMDYHQMRVLLLISAVSQTKGHAGKLDGLTKLAKLDFLVRYPALLPKVLEGAQAAEAELELAEADLLAPTDVEAPMMRYRYGPWDNRYYPIIGSLVGRGLVGYVKGRRGSVALKPTPKGSELAADLEQSRLWRKTSARCLVAAEASRGLTGNALKRLIYERLPELMDRPHREAIL